MLFNGIIQFISELGLVLNWVVVFVLGIVGGILYVVLVLSISFRNFYKVLIFS